MVPGNKGGILESNHRIFLYLNINMYAGRYLYMQVDLYMQIDLYMQVDICIIFTCMQVDICITREQNLKHCIVGLTNCKYNHGLRVFVPANPWRYQLNYFNIADISAI